MTTKGKLGLHEHDGGFKNTLRPHVLRLEECLHSFSYLEGLELILGRLRATNGLSDQE